MSFDRYRTNRFHLAPEAIVPFAVGLLIVSGNFALALVIAVLTGSWGLEPAAADSVNATQTPMPACAGPAPVTMTVARSGHSDQPVPFGFLVFDQEFSDGRNGAEPLQARTCVYPKTSDERESAYAAVEGIR